MKNLKPFVFLIVGLSFLGSPSSISGQDVAELAMRARNNLYDNWNFDSVGYYFDKVIGKKYAPAFAYSDYGWYLILKGKFNQGLVYIQKAADMDPSYVQLLAWNAWAKLWNNDIPEATKWVNKALALDQNNGEALHLKSLLASEVKNHKEAIRLAKKAAQNDPNWRAGIPLAMAKGGLKDQALEWAKKIATNENAFDAMLLIEVYANLGDDEKALDYFEKSYELHHPFMPWLEFVPKTEHLHNNPRYKSILKKMNLPK